ncbi:hypothetical protein [Agrobacterium tumefaciens]|jgi:hypothetical protein|uniref:hypothetical protein n=1 Tax=Agrobacterium tumefaciens TaxID=358 RepID=UPI0004729AB1
MSDKLKPNFKFGDRVINGWASKDNPQREAYFIRYVRVEGRVNSGAWAEVTDGKGKVWQQAYDRMELAQPEAVTNAGDVVKHIATISGGKFDDQEHMNAGIRKVEDYASARTATAEADLAKAREVIAELVASNQNLLDDMARRCKQDGLNHPSRSIRDYVLDDDGEPIFNCGNGVLAKLENALQSARAFMEGK